MPRTKIKFNDELLAAKVIDAYATHDDPLGAMPYFPVEECLKVDARLALFGRCEALHDTLAYGSEGEVTEDEKIKLMRKGLTRKFTETLAGPDGKKALRQRVKWLTWRLSESSPSSDKERLARDAKINELGRYGVEAAPAAGMLIAILEKTEDEVVKSWFKDSRETTLWITVMALGSIGGAAAGAVPKLAELLAHGDIRISYNAAEALGKIGATSPPAVAALAEGLAHDDFRVRHAAAVALGKIGKPAHHALPFLENMRDNAEEDINGRKAAGEAVENISKDVK